ncbi:hypothetical protein MRB53_035906 [Persea americana]|uniref:Uncharacterized protein n=1 Tax=Persea americana TaxID=3435 RepID=A0ACC2K5Z3_PERAE|nr:hypothetical protein MRB53_035906 [Persea americana]
MLLYLCEMAPVSYRCFFNLLFQIMITIGIHTANLVNYDTYKIKGGWRWRVSFAGAAVPAAIITVGGALFLVDTPNSLNKCHPERAKSSNGPVTAGSERNNILLRKHRPQLVMAILIPVFQQLTAGPL